MADINPVGEIEGRGVGLLVNRLAGPAGFFLPSFYNTRYSNPRQGFANSEASRLVKGDKRAWRNFGGRKGGQILGGMLGGPIGAIAGGWLGPHLLNLVNGEGWNGDRPAPVPTVVANGMTYDAYGNLVGGGYGGGFSNFGPYAGGYQGLPESPSNDFLPNFSGYGDQFTTPGDNEPYAPINDNAEGGGYAYTGGGYKGGGGNGLSGGSFSGGNTWGGGFSGAMLQNIGLAGSVQQMGVPLAWSTAKQGGLGQDAFGGLGGILGTRVVYVAE